MMMLNGVSELEKALQFVGLGQGQAGGNTEAAGKKRRRRWRRRRRSISRWREEGGFQSTLEAKKYWAFRYYQFQFTHVFCFYESSHEIEQELKL